VLTGFIGSDRTYLGFFQSALNLLPEGNQKGELLGLFRPGYHRPSYSRAFASKLNKSELVYDCNIHGGDRACIACGYCAQVCPVDIMPQFTYKSILAGEVEESLAHGLLDCAECGLCSYVCPSKIELAETLRKARADYYIEQSK
jgi:Na+-transporting NADH:ubiquinone oxidoreductase subunit A